MNMKDHLKIPTLKEIANYTGNGVHGAEGEGGFLSRIDTIEAGAGSGGRTIDGQLFSDIWTDLNTRLAIFNEQANRMVGLLTFPVDRAQDRVSVPWTPEFERATEFGRPSKTRFKTIFRGFPLAHWDLGYGFTQEFLDDSKASEIMAVQVQSESAYWALQMRTAMTALFDNAPDASDEGVTVLPLYNADGEVPPNYRRWTHTGSHAHYLTSAALDVAALGTMETHLIHHGYGDDSMGGAGGKIFLHVNRANMAAVRALAGFVPATTATSPTIIDGQVVGLQRSGEMGLNPEGYFGKMIVIENNEVPAGYLMALVSGGIFSNQNPVGMRQHENTSARGLRLIEGNRAHYPLIESVYDTYLGAGVRHRGAAVVTQITAGAYEVPAL